MGKVVVLLLLVAGSVGTWFALIQPLALIRKAQDWRAEDCQITQSSLSRSVTTDRSRPGSDQKTTTYGLQIRYKYVVDGKEYESSRYSFLDGISTSAIGRKNLILEKYSSGRVVTCYVDPKDPQSAVLNRGFIAEMLLGLIPLGLFFLGFLGTGVIPASILNDLANRIPADPNAEPPAWPPPDSSAASTTTAGRATLTPEGEIARLPDVRIGFQASILLVGLAVFNLISAIGDEVSNLPLLLVHVLILVVLSYGYRRLFLPAALALVAYPGTLVMLLAILTLMPPAPGVLTGWLLQAAPVGSLVPLFVEGPERVAAYVRAVTSLSILLLPIGFLLFRGIRMMIRKREESPLPALAGVGLCSMAVIAAFAAAGVTGRSPAAEQTTHATMDVKEVGAGVTSPDAATRTISCAQAQGMTDLSADMVPGLIEAAKQGDEAARATCLSALGRAGSHGADAIPLLLASLKDPSSYVRFVAVQSLAEIAAKAQRADLLPEVLNLVRDPDGLVRRFAVTAIGEFGPQGAGAMPMLRKALFDKELDVREAAARVLVGLGRDAAPATPELAAALADPEPRIRQVAAEALGAIGPDARVAAAALTKATSDSSETVRSAAVAALAAIDGESPAVLAQLIVKLSDPDDGVRGQAIMGIEKIGPKAAPAVPALILVLSQKPLYLRLWAIQALMAIGPAAGPAIPRLTEMVTEKLISNEMEAAQIPEAAKAAIEKIRR